MSRRALIFTLLLTMGRLVAAKPIVLRWEPLKHTVQYELVIQRDGSDVATPKVDGKHTEWRGDLEPGIYVYKVRAIDFTERPGEWSPPRPLVVMPRAPDAIAPAAGSVIGILSPREKAKLEWKPVEGVKKFAVEARVDGREILHKTVEGTEVELPNLVVGHYEWRVHPIMQASERDPAEIAGRSWTSEKATVAAFEVKRDSLPAPQPIEPLGVVEGRVNEPMRFHWKAVPRAEAYEIRLLSRSGTKSFVTDGTSYMATVPTPGRHVWRVRALAGIDEKRKPATVGDAGRAVFVLIPGTAHASAFQAWLLLGATPYTYEVSTPEASTRLSGRGGQLGFAFDLGLQYRLDSWALAFEARRTSWEVVSHVFNRTDLDLVLSRDIRLASASRWWLIPRVGLSLRQNRELQLPESVSALQDVSDDAPAVGLFGPTLGLALQYQLSRTWWLGLRADYLIPLSVLGAEAGAELTHTTSFRNYRLSLYGEAWISSHVALIGSVDCARSAVSYDAGGEHQIQMNQWFFLGGARFGW